MVSREYQGPAIDGGYQHISEAPAYQDPDGETVDATDPEPIGEETTEGDIELTVEDPDVEGQSTLDDWRWSA